MKVQFTITVKEGFRRVMSDYIENEIDIVIEAANYATASRMVKALFKDAANVVEIDGGVCLVED